MTLTLMDEMRKKPRSRSEVGARLIALRKARGLTQVELAAAIGATQRAISYYENEADAPPAPVVAALARALGVTTDELFGLKPMRSPRPAGDGDPRAQRIHKKLHQLLRLPEKDQRAVIRLVNSLVAAKGSRRD